MKVMILAAGRGKRMGSLTENCPKPLLEVDGLSLIGRLISSLKENGFDELVVNLAYKGEQIKAALGSGESLGVSIEYSDEAGRALETGGGIVKALPLLGHKHFMVVNADIWTDFPFQSLQNKTTHQAHLVLVDNPSHNDTGDFFLSNGCAQEHGELAHTFSGIGVYHPSLFDDESNHGAFPLAPILRKKIKTGDVSAQLYNGLWVDVGTPERLAAVST